MWKFPGYGSNQSYSCQTTPEPQQLGIWAMSSTYTIAHGNTRSLTHCVRPGVEPASSRILVSLFLLCHKGNCFCFLNRQVCSFTVLFICLFSFYSCTCGIWKSQARGRIRAAAGVYDTAMTTPDMGYICNPRSRFWQCQILNPLNEAKDWTHMLTKTTMGP